MHTWKNFILEEQQKDYYKNLISKVDEDRKSYTIFPEEENILKAFKLSSYENTKVLILGQDPYINSDDTGCQAQGLSFSVPTGMSLPPSLKNIYKELLSDVGVDNGKNGNLEPWANQGVLLLNSVLTVRKGASNSHKDYGWTKFTDAAISLLAEKKTPVVFILWGAYARNKVSLIDKNKHLILESAHPSPLSCNNGFFNYKPFSKTNNFLIQNQINPIDWKV